MRVVLQRVRSGTVTIDDQVMGMIGQGYVLLVGFTHTDTVEEVGWMAEKILSLRLFADVNGRMNLGLADVGGALLVVSQFTLYGDARKGRRPSFIDAARPETAVPLYEHFVNTLRASGGVVQTGEFGADMQVSLMNDGPVTLLLERESAAGALVSPTSPNVLS